MSTSVLRNTPDLGRQETCGDCSDAGNRQQSGRILISTQLRTQVTLDFFNLLIEILIVSMKPIDELDQPRLQIVKRKYVGQSAQRSFGCRNDDTEFEQQTMDPVDGGRTFGYQTFTRSM